MFPGVPRPEADACVAKRLDRAVGHLPGRAAPVAYQGNDRFCRRILVPLLHIGCLDFLEVPIPSCLVFFKIGCTVLQHIGNFAFFGLRFLRIKGVALRLVDGLAALCGNRQVQRCLIGGTVCRDLHRPAKPDVIMGWLPDSNGNAVFYGL